MVRSGDMMVLGQTYECDVSRRGGDGRRLGARRLGGRRLGRVVPPQT